MVGDFTTMWKIPTRDFRMSGFLDDLNCGTSSCCPQF
jgi:hypothetical protein